MHCILVHVPLLNQQICGSVHMTEQSCPYLNLCSCHHRSHGAFTILDYSSPLQAVTSVIAL